MLTVMDFLPVAFLAGGQQIWVAASGDRPRLSAEHGTKAEPSRSDVPLSHSHHPVDAAGLLVSSLAFAFALDRAKQTGSLSEY